MSCRQLNSTQLRNPPLPSSHAFGLFLIARSLLLPFLSLFLSLYHLGTFFSHIFLEEFTKNILFFMDPKKALPSLIASKREPHHLFHHWSILSNSPSPSFLAVCHHPCIMTSRYLFSSPLLSYLYAVYIAVRPFLLRCPKGAVMCHLSSLVHSLLALINRWHVPSQASTHDCSPMTRANAYVSTFLLYPPLPTKLPFLFVL